MGNILPRNQRLRIRSFPRTISTLLWTSWVPHTGGMLRDPVPGTDGTLRYRYRAGADQIPRRHPRPAAGRHAGQGHPARRCRHCRVHASPRRHAVWNLSADRAPNFPKARFLVPQDDWEFFSKMANTNPQMQQVTPLQNLGLMELISGETPITSEVTTYPTPGHTPGHTSILISSNGQRAIVTGDFAHHPASVDHTAG